MILCFGEMLLRLSPPGAFRIVQTDSFDAVFGGAEANVAQALTGFGDRASVLTRLPDNEVGHACENAVRRYGTDTSRILWGGDRIGLYFLEKGASLRPSKVLYDRRDSAFAKAAPELFDWDALFEDVNGFFFTGITPAVSETLPGITASAVAAARKKGIPVFCDVNYRATLWPKEKAGEVMRALITGIDTLIVNEEHAALLLGVSSSLEDENERLLEVSERLARQYHIRRVALTMRLSESSEINTVSAALYESGALYRSRPYRIPIVDRVGGGDAFAAGLIHAFLAGWDPARTVEFATAANAYKHSIHGDALIASAAEVERLASSDGTIRMIR